MRPKPPLYFGLGLLAGSVLLLEIALTRVFAIMLWHHLAYMVISVAMLGFGAAGSLLAVRGSGRDSSDPARALAWLSTAYAVAVPLVLWLAVRLPVDSLALRDDPSQLARLGLLYGIIFVPFLCAGAAIGLVLTRYAAHAGRLYGFDLAGSALGGAAGVALLAALGPSGAVASAGVLGAGAAWAFAFAAGSPARAVWPAAGAAAVLGLAIAVGALRVEIPFEPGKEFARIAEDAEITRIPSATAEVEVGPDAATFPISGGGYGRASIHPVHARWVGQDGTAPTMLFRNAAKLEKFRFLDGAQAAAPHLMRAASTDRGARVLVIGTGGGIDVMVALRHGAAEVTAVEINRAMVEAVSEDFDAYLGGLFRPGAHAFSDRVALVHGEGRSFARTGEYRWDLIQLNGVDSFTALSTGAYTLSESYLYTVEAVRDFYSRLEEGGILAISRFIMRHPKRPRETLRLANIARSALVDLDVEDPGAQIAVFRGFLWATTLVKRGRFDVAEMDALRSFADREGFWGLVYDPLQPRPPALVLPARFEEDFRDRVGRLVEAGKVPPLDPASAGLAEAWREASTGRSRAAGAALRRIVATLPAAGQAEALRVLGRVLQRDAADARARVASFESTRNDFATLLAGNEPERDAFVDGYPYDIRPTTDDAPFFFNYYRYAGLLGGSSGGNARRSTADYYHPDYPVGHAVLLGSLAQISALAAIFILLPLRKLAASGAPGVLRARVFLYFAALGCGFMFIEIALMQKFVLFLGHPTYAITLVLCVLLAASGVGSLLSSRLDVASPATFRRLLAALLAILLLDLVLVSTALPLALGWSLPVRGALAGLLLAPLGLVLGMPFPLGLRLLDVQCPALVPWAWAINSFLSVFASIFCIILAMAIGFSQVLLLAGAVYAAGLLTLAPAAASVRS